MIKILVNAGTTIHVPANTVFKKLDKNFNFRSYVAAIPLTNTDVIYLQPTHSGDNYSQQLIANEKIHLLKGDINNQKFK